MSERWQTILAIDFDKWAAATYAANFPGVEVRCAKVGDEIDNLPAADVVIGGPPCQGYSMAGKGEGANDDRDGLPDFVAAVRKVRPRMFLMENVDGMLNEKHARHVGDIHRQLESNGYSIEVRVLDAVNYGVPQFRKRCWWWGIRSDVYAVGARHRWPMPTHCEPGPAGQASLFGGGLLPWVTVGMALGLEHIGIRRLAGPNSQQAKYGHTYTEDEPCPSITNIDGGKSGLVVHEYRWSDAMLQKHPPRPPRPPAPTVQAKWFKGGAEGLVLVEIDTKQNRTNRPIYEPAPTVAGDSRHHLREGGLYVRRLTPDECLRLQSGPDDFRWPDGISKTNKYRVIGNGWACGIAAHLSRALAEADPMSRTVIDLYCGGGLGACGWHGRYWRYEPTNTEAVA